MKRRQFTIPNIVLSAIFVKVVDTFQLMLLTINSHQEREGDKGYNLNEASFILVPNSLDTELNWLAFRILFDKAVIKISSEAGFVCFGIFFFHLIFKLYLDTAFCPIGYHV